MNTKIEQPTFAAFAGAEGPAKAAVKRTVCAAKIAEPPTVTSARAAQNNRAIQAAARAAKREEQAKRKAEKAAEKAAKKANDAVNKVMKKAEKAAEREAKRAAKAAAKKLPPKSWEATKAEIAAMVREAAGETVANPKSTKGLVCLNFLGDHIKRERLPQYAAALRRACEVRWEYIGKWPAAVFEDELRTAGGDEAVALSMLGVLFHNDRGDGLIYVPVFASRGRMEAWQAACASVGITESKVRPA